MGNKFYLQKTLELHKEAIDLCNELHRHNKSCTNCEYIKHTRCKVSCLQKNYNIIELNTLQELDMDEYVDIHDFCMLTDFKCNAHAESSCDICLIEHLLANKNIKIMKKRISNE